MKILLLLLISAVAHAQPNLEISFNNHGGRIGGGYVEPSTGITLQAVHNFPIVRYDKPHTTMVFGGYEHILGNGFTVTGLAGAAFNAYTTMGKDAGYKNSTMAAGSVEFAWDKHMGRLFAYGSYTGNIYIGFGMKVRFE